MRFSLPLRRLTHWETSSLPRPLRTYLRRSRPSEAPGETTTLTATRFASGLAVVLGASWLARLVFAEVVPPQAHSVDVDSWMLVARQLRQGVNPYVTTHVLNWPPVWMLTIWALDHAAHALGLSFFTTLRLFLIGVESVLIVVLYSFLARVAPSEARRVVLVGISLNPIAIFLVCEHGNFDVLVGLFCLIGALCLASFATTRRSALWIASSFAFGLGAVTKTVPLILGPLLSRGWKLSRPRSRALGAALFLGPILVGLGVILAQAPRPVLDNVILYRSEPGFFGLTGLTNALHLPGLTDAYAKEAFPLILGIWFVLGWIMLTRRDLDARRILLLVGMLLMAVPALGPGYAPQYAYWWLPVFVATYPLFDVRWRRVLCTAYPIVAATYLVEYAFLTSQGAFLDAFFPSNHFISHASTTLIRPETQSLFRLPLFLTYLFVLGTATSLLRSSPLDRGPRRCGSTRAG